MKRSFKLSVEQRKALHEELRKKGLEVALDLVPVPRDGMSLPLSFAQERFWVLDRLEPGTPAYNMPMVADLEGELRVGAAGAALDEVVRRHESLRTTFGVRDGVPLQQIAPPATAGLTLVELRALPEEERRLEAARLTARQARRSFDLERGPLHEAVLLGLGKDRHRLLFNVHHIVADGWSIGVLLQEFGALYTAFSQGKGSPLPHLAVQYADFAMWQRRWLAAREKEELGYWLERLSGELSPLALPIDRPRPAMRTFHSGQCARVLTPGVAHQLRAFSRRERSTLFMTLLAGAQALLARQAGQEDVVVGAPVAGRRRLEVQGLIGCFLNSLVLRTDLSGSPSLRQLLGRVRDVTVGAYSHQDVPFEALLARLGVERDPGRTPLFQVFFNMLNIPPGKLSLPGLRLEALTTPALASQFDMTFYVQDGKEAIRFDLVYNADLFDAARMEELLAQLELLLAQAVELPEEPIARLSLVTRRAAAQLPDPAAALDASWVGAVHELFAARARRAPERPAVADREGVWSYGELAEASGRLAAWLAAQGVGRGDCVAIYAHRSAPLVQAVVGTLAAGAAFTLLDPAYPAAMLVEILRLAAPSAWLQLAAAGTPPAGVGNWLSTSSCPRRELPGGGAAAALDALEGLAGAWPEVAAGPEDVACLAFTSGSTGTPKGILGRHGPLSHFLPWQCARFGLRAEDRFSLLSGLAHDPLQRDIFTPLYLGAAVCVPDPREIAAAGHLAEWMAREGVTVAHLTPAMAQLLTEPPGGQAAVEVPSLRLALLVGDALTRLDVARIRRLAPGVTCVNLYGSTETQRAVGFHLVKPCEAGARDKQVLPLGRGMQDVQLLVLNGAGLHAGVGEVGEIAVRSPHLARGYLGDEALTAEKFQLNPFTGATGDRIYRTGDLGRYLPNGEVTFVGRADLQVKIRGFRIEPAEIELSLASLPGVREAAVLARDQSGERRLVAYVVPEREGAVAVDGLRAALRQRLPAHMVPSDFVLLPRLALNPNGKVDRRALAAMVPEEARRSGAPLQGELERQIAAAWREVLGVEEIGADDNFFDAGGHSLLLVRLHSRLEAVLGRAVPLVDLFGHPTVRSQAERLGHGTTGRLPPEPARGSPWPRRDGGGTDGRIAIIGMAGRFPEAPDLDRFWESLRDGVDGITRFSDDELAAAGVRPEQVRRARSVRARGILADVDRFDAAFFDFSPLQARIMDPQLRLLLECAWQAIESAGYDPGRYAGSIGVHAGMSLPSYFLSNLASRPDLLEAVGGYQAAIAVDRDYLTTQVSYKLGLTGPSLNVQTACSTSLVAVHLACQALLGGECDMSIAGGVSVKVPQVSAYPYEEGGIDSLSGRCRVFDASADGTVWGSGVGLVVLKRLADALADGDHIHAVILGSAINNDGSFKVGYTAPSIEGQAKVIAAAQARAGVSPDTISYVEAHGTGTPLGDPIEVAALTRAFRLGTCRSGFCALGSVKSNVGHLGAAAGIAGLIKTVLALEQRQIPPSLGFEASNPAIDFAASPFYVTTALCEWRCDGTPRRAGVSSFGLGGTNAHVVLEEAPEAAPAGPSRLWQLLPLSARSEAALEAATESLANWLARHPDADLADIAWTLQVGRRAFAWRRILVCRHAEEARRALAGRDPRAMITVRCDAACHSVAFLFPGQGVQYAGMGWGLYRGEPAFRREVDACAELLRPLLGRDLREVLYPAAERREEAERELLRTRLAQPALFVTEYALARLWMSWGICPWAMIGHSLGEYVAACLAGVFSLADALALVTARGELIDELPPGAMLSVELGEEDLAPLLGPSLALAAVNGPSLCVASGPEGAVAALEARLVERGAGSRRLHTSHAFHSAMMEPVLARFGERVARVELRPPAIPYLSNLTGEWIAPAEATDPDYWVRHLRSTVRFGAGIGSLLAGAPGSVAVLVEVGPGRALGSLARQARPKEGPVTVAAMRRPTDEGEDEAVLQRALGRLWLAGVEIAWEGLKSGERRRRLRLPTYPFERQRHWVEPAWSGPAAERDTSARQPATLPATYNIELPAEILETLGKLAGDGMPDWQLVVTRSAEGGTCVTLTRASELSPPSLPAAPSEAAVLDAGPKPEPEGLAAHIAKLFGRLLGVQSVGEHDDFFELGGHSLLGTRLLSLLRDELGIELPLDRLFESPTPAGLAACTAGLAASRPGPATAIPLASRDGELPLSFAQERLWFLDWLDPASAAYNLPVAIRIRGGLDPGCLERALSEVVRRHESLRTTFPEVDGRPVQRIGQPRPIVLPRVDLSAVAGGRDEALRLAGEEARSPFSLAHAPLLRAMLVQLGDGEHLLVANIHHIVSDGWSQGVLVREVSALYGAFAAGEPALLPELKVQYADYAIWQRRELAGEKAARELAYWTRQLGGALPVLEIPTDRPRPRRESFRGARERFAIDAGLTASLRRLGVDHGATLFMTLLAAYAALLGRYCHQDDVAVGSPIAGRTRTELEGLIGLFVNTLVLRVDLCGAAGFAPLLERVRATALAAYAHQELPFEKVVAALQPERDLGRSPLFQAFFVVQNAPISPLAAGDLEIEPLESYHGTALFDLSLSVSEVATGIAGYLEVKTELLDSTTARRWTEHLANLLTAAAETPERPLGELPLLSAAERHQARFEWVKAPSSRPRGACFQDLFAARVDGGPDRIAVVFAGGVLSYRELDRRAARLATYLRSLGVSAEVPVGVCLEAGPERVVGILAVLEAGGAYLPLDPTYPRDRLALLLEDAGAPVLVTTEKLLANLPATPARLVCLDRDRARIEGQGEWKVTSGVPENLAYVMYTSGSTGRPKGVLIEARSLSWYSLTAAANYGIQRGDRVLQFASISFDISVEEIFPCLASGATLVLAGPDTRLSLDDFLTQCRQDEVTFLTLPTAFWHELSSEVCRSPERLPASLRVVCIGGEKALFDRVDAWLGSVDPRIALFNSYGPTETTVVAALQRVGAGTLRGRGEVPLGRPIPGAAAYVVGDDFAPLPIGVAGELCIGGEGVGRGYLGQRGQTAECFVPSPFEQGGRLYRSGDRARWLSDGSLEFLGRLDTQVKVRGFRIEPGEIEAALVRHPAVEEAAVVACAEAERPLLAACYVARADAVPEENELRRFLVARLPEYMVPALFVAFAELPLLPNGKVDRRALARRALAELAPRPLESGWGTPRTPAEHLLTEIWRDVLGIPQIGIHDNFFALGGDSILCIQLTSRARSAGLHLLPRQIFEGPTIAQLAALTAKAPDVEREPVAGEVPLSPLQRGAGGLTPSDFPLARLSQEALDQVVEAAAADGRVEDLYPASPMQQAMIFHTVEAPGSGVYVSQITVPIGREIDPGAFERAWNRLILRHAVLRTAFVWSDSDRPLQVVLPDVRCVLAREDWRGIEPAERDRRLTELLSMDRRRGFDLGKPPLLRLTLIDLGEPRYLFLWSSHHVLFDGWSLPILFRELSLLYEEERRGGASRLAPAPLFRDYIAWLGSRDPGEAERHWRRALAGFAEPTPLGIDRPAYGLRPDGAPVAVHQSAIPAAVTDGLRAFARARGLTFNTVVEGAWALLLSRRSGREDVVFGTVSSGRSAPLPGIDSMVGVFINSLPARVAAHGPISLIAWLHDLQERQAAARQFEEVPLFRIQSWSEVPHGRLLFESLLAFENYPAGESTRELAQSFGLGEIEIREQTSFPLFITAIPRRQLNLRLHFDAVRFDRTTIGRLLGHLGNLFASMLASPGANLESLCLLSPAEQHQVLTEWNDSEISQDDENLLPRLIKAQVERTPERVAVVFGEELLTYGGLDARANQVAQLLRRLGVGADVPVAICANRSLDLVIGLLGILKAGGAYVPLDPTYPRERLSFMLRDALAGAEHPVVLVQESLTDLLMTDLAGAAIVCLDGGGTTWGAESVADPEPGLASENLAYMIFTSGSTGRPKGVQIAHGALANLLASMREVTGLGAGDSLLAITTLSFDIAALELFLPLVNGAQVVLVSQEVARDGERLRERLDETGATFLQATPATWRLLLGAGWKGNGQLNALCGGEALPRDLADALLAEVGSLWNVYGPTETTIWSSSQPIREREAISIGRPLASTQIYLLSEHLVPVALGGVGELCIGGAGVARGYRNQPRLTAERFVPDPFAAARGVPGAVIYRTGDLARHRSDGSVEILGRIDHQVKVRGFRIEPGEIEATLALHQAVREAVVVVGDHRRQRLLAAYYVPHPDSAAEPGELQDFLRCSLPEHMIPALFVPLPELPRLPNGKVDRGDLSRMARTELEQGPLPKSWEAPRTPEENLLAGIWQDLLGVPLVGIHDNFFALGGDSILSIQLALRARRAGLHLLARHIFESPTIAQLAVHASAAPKVAEEPEPPAGQMAGSDFGEQPRAPGAGGFTPSDFPLAKVGQATLDRVVRAVAIQGAVEDLYPASATQQAMLFHTLQAPRSGAYLNQLTVAIGRQLDPAAFERAWNGLILRHPVLRTAFVWLDSDRPLQAVLPAVRLVLEHEDWRDVAPAERERRVAERLRDDRRRGFDLAEPPLMRLVLIDLGEPGYLFAWTYHHVVLDGWSLTILFRELFHLYEEERRGGTGRLAPAPLFRDYIAWLERRQTGEAERFWRRRLAGFSEPTPLGIDRPIPGARSRGDSVGLRQSSVSAAATDALREFARARELTVNTLVEGAWAILLSRYSGREEVVFGTVSSGRSAPLPGIDSIVGVFINTLPARVAVPARTGLLPWLHELQERQALAREHEDSPLSQIQARSEVARGRPLFESILAFENFPIEESTRAELAASLGLGAVETLEQTSFPLSIAAVPRRQLHLHLHFDPARLEGTAVDRLLGHLRAVLLGMPGHADAILGDLSPLTAEESHQLSLEWNDSAGELGAGGCVHRLFTEQAERTPDAVALVFGERSLSFAELNLRAMRLGHYLQTLGVGPEARVGICVERSLEMVVGLLGILKAGGAYVPLDPTYPRERLAFMIADSGMAVLLADEEALAGLAQGGLDSAVRVTRLEAGCAESAGEEWDGFADVTHTGNLAYVIYTSGTTGRPKGVLVEHSNLASVLAASLGELGWGPSDRALCLAPFSFDIFLFEVLSPLLAGGCCTIVPLRPVLEIESLAGLLAEATCLHAVPALMRQVVEAARRTGRSHPALRTLFVGGEEVPLELLREMRRVFPRTEIRILYGPTEGTIICANARIAAGEEPCRSILGRPFSHAEIHLRDSMGRLVPIGVPGEIWLGGSGVTRGYLGHGELTAERYPFLGGRRFYRTGDLACQLPGGELQFLGRIDRQVKVRGFRVEPGEIEAALSLHPAVREVAVVLREDLSAGPGLVAYVVPRDGANLPADELATFLEESLPQYMMPAYFQPLERLPLTPHGKVDRQALPAPECRLEVAYAAPANELEVLITEIWSEILGLPRVGRNDNFFDLGGHSILMIQMRDKLQDRIQQSIAMLDLFRHPTVSSLAAFLSRSPAEQTLFVSPGHGKERRAGGERLKQRLGRRQASR